MKTLYSRLRGMPDLTPDDTPAWHALEAAVREVMKAYGYREMRTPLVERTTLFERSIGEATDIIEKEMYVFDDRRGESIALRPENTAGCVRAAIENGLLQPGSVSRIWYQGPMFRYERPQLGRQRQFFQTGAEVYGVAGPSIEAELILLSARLWQALGLGSAVQLEINTLGSKADRDGYRAALVDWFGRHQSALDDDSRRRLTRNPLRILDSKNPAMADLIADAPAMRDSLSDDSRAHFDTLQALLAGAGLEAQVNPTLVRGLDYYSHTVFEWTTDRLGAQSAVCAGGRYDGLLEQMGAAGVPGVGWALGMERVLALRTALALDVPAAESDVYVVFTDAVGDGDALVLAEHLRDALPARSVVLNPGAASLKNQFRKADRSGAVVAVVIGADELASATVTVKPLRGGEQCTVERAGAAAVIEPLIAAHRDSHRSQGHTVS